MIVLPCNQALPQSATRSAKIEVTANNKQAGVEIDLQIRKLGSDRNRNSGSAKSTKFAVGDKVIICFKVSRKGFVTVWDQTVGDLGLETSLIFPNKYSHAGGQARAEEVQSGQELCIGEHRNWEINVDQPVAEARVLVHWTQRIDEALPANAYPEPVAKAKQSRSSKSEEQYASRTISYSAN